MKTYIFILLISLAIPSIVSAHGMMDSISSTTFEMMRGIENKALPSDELHEEMEELMTKMMTGKLSDEEANKMVEFMGKYPGPVTMMMNRMGMNNMMMNQQGFNQWMVPGGGGMMKFGINSINPFINIWHWIAFLALIIWLIVGFLAAIWLWKRIQGKIKKYYTCPMHPEVRQEHAGMCPECGMSLLSTEKKIESSKDVDYKEHTENKNHSTSVFLKKFWVSLILTIPILAYSELPELFLGIRIPYFSGSEYLQLVLGSVVFFYGGIVFLSGAWRELRALLPGMMTLISFAISAAYLWSVYAVFVGNNPLFWELATLITVMLIGHWLEIKAVQKAKGSLKELAKLLPDKVEVVKGEKIDIIPIANLKEGDIVLIKPGSKVPADGEVIEGESELNESIITGESRLVHKKVGDEVIAGTINGDSSLKVKVTKIGEDTFLAEIMRLVVQAQASKSRLQLLSDKAAFYLTIVAVVFGVLTFSIWILKGADTAFAVARLVAVLVIACPHALGLAIPLVASISTNIAASAGFLVKNRLALENARDIDVVLFDKTGTLTKGEFELVGNLDRETLFLASSLEALSEHPIAKAIVRKAYEEKIKLTEVRNFRRIPGVGTEGEVNEKKVFIGNKGGDEIVIEVDGREVGTVSVMDVSRPESKEAIKQLHQQGIKVAMLTGDSQRVAYNVAKDLGIDEYFARVLPPQKAEKVKEFQKKGLKVAMVGDGVNDAPALMQADLGIAIGAGTNVAIESAGIILVRNDPRDIPKIIKLSKLTFKKMTENLFWALSYNVVTLPLAAGVLISKGIVLDPALSAVFMSLSTIIVAINALLLKRATI